MILLLEKCSTSYLDYHFIVGYLDSCISNSGSCLSKFIILHDTEKFTETKIDDSYSIFHTKLNIGCCFSLSVHSH